MCVFFLGATRPAPVVTVDAPEITPIPITCIKRNRLIKMNTVNIIHFSTVVPFRWHRLCYFCFYCNSPLNTFDALKTHTEREHESTNMKSIGILIKKDDKVKIDVASINCKVCNSKCKDLDEIIDHLKDAHGKEFYDDLGYGVMPYKHHADTCQCAICDETFQSYIKLNQHMNKHFGEHVCEVCGKSFLSTRRLKIHTLSHGSGFPCNRCSETFDSYAKRKNHYAKTHDIPKVHKCSYCPETFHNYGARTLHHRYTHNIDTPIYNCPVCGKTFRLCSRMQYHLNSVHAKS